MKVAAFSSERRRLWAPVAPSVCFDNNHWSEATVVASHFGCRRSGKGVEKCGRRKEVGEDILEQGICGWVLPLSGTPFKFIFYAYWMHREPFAVTVPQEPSTWDYNEYNASRPNCLKIWLTEAIYNILMSIGWRKWHNEFRGAMKYIA